MSFSRVSSTRLCPHGNCPTACWTIAASGHASAKARMYMRLAREKPFMSGNAARKSCANRSITLAPSLAQLAEIGCRGQSASRAAPAHGLRPALIAAEQREYDFEVGQPVAIAFGGGVRLTGTLLIPSPLVAVLALPSRCLLPFRSFPNVR